jgi:hypothetical protein
MPLAITPLSHAIAHDGRPLSGRMLRSFTALSLVALYFFSISFLTLSGLCAMSEHSGQHQMLIRDHKVILHHFSGVTHEHDSFAAMFANSSERDHEIAYSDLVNSTQNSEEKRMLDHGGSDLDQEDTSFLSNNSLSKTRTIAAEKMRHHNAMHAIFLEQWRYLRLNI